VRDTGETRDREEYGRDKIELTSYFVDLAARWNRIGREGKEEETTGAELAN
jgi:hypothetical protein